MRNLSKINKIEISHRGVCDTLIEELTDVLIGGTLMKGGETGQNLRYYTPV